VRAIRNFLATRPGGLLAETWPGWTVAGTGTAGAFWMLRIEEPIHAVALAGTAWVVGTILLIVAAAGGGVRAALRSPRLRAAGHPLPKGADPVIGAVHAEAESALNLAAMLERNGQRVLGAQLAGSAIELVRSALELQQRRARLMALPGARSESAAHQCAEALGDIGASLASLRQNLGEAGAAEELTAASVDDVLRTARAAAADASASAEVAFIGVAVAPLEPARRLEVIR
jgi:hypothetical protein